VISELRWALARFPVRCGEIAAGLLGFRLPEPEPSLAWLTEAWERRWSGALPISWMLKLDLSETWVRFHSLPGSKRYADSDDEYEILLARHHQVLGELRDGSGRDLLLIRARADAGGRFSASKDFRLAARTTPLWQTFLDRDDSAGDPVRWYIFVDRIAPTREALDPLLRRIADDEDRAILTNDQLDWLYAPYDGGADVIVGTVNRRDQLRTLYTDWLPMGAQIYLKVDDPELRDHLRRRGAAGDKPGRDVVVEMLAFVSCDEGRKWIDLLPVDEREFPERRLREWTLIRDVAAEPRSIIDDLSDASDWCQRRLVEHATSDFVLEELAEHGWSKRVRNAARQRLRGRSPGRL
jgi:hypothetical protein